MISAFRSSDFQISGSAISSHKNIHLKSNIGDIKNVNHILVPYDEVLDCCEERDKYNQQIVRVIFKNGIIIDFECVGMRL